MAGELTGSRTASQRAVQGLGFASGIYLAYDCMSTLNSSPWTHETFGGDPGKAASAQQYVRMSLIRSTGLAVLTSWVMGDLSPLLGATVANVDLYLIYRRAGNLATSRGH